MPGDTWVPGGNDGDPGAAYRDPHITVEVDGTTDNSSCGQEPILAFGHVWVEGQCWVLMAGRALSELSLLSPLGFVLFIETVSLCNNPGCPRTHLLDQVSLELTESLLSPMSSD